MFSLESGAAFNEWCRYTSIILLKHTACQFTAKYVPAVKQKKPPSAKLQKADRVQGHAPAGWGKRIRTFEMPESESGALPLGYTPKYYRESDGWDSWTRTSGMEGSKPSALPLGYIPMLSLYITAVSYSFIIIPL